MKNFYLLLAVAALAFGAAFEAGGQNVRTDTLTLDVKFRNASSVIEPGYRDNGSNIAAFERTLKAYLEDTAAVVSNINIRTSASPAGYTEDNRRLTVSRAKSIEKLLVDKMGFDRSLFTLEPIGEDMDGLARMVAALDTPWRDQVLDILNSAPAPEKGEDPRKVQIRQIDDGRVYWWLSTYLFPDLRAAGGAVTCVVSRRAPEHAPAPQPKDTIYMSQRDTVVVRDTLIIIHDYPEDFPYVAGFRAKKIKIPADQTPSWAVKTNLLMLGALAPNIEVEIPLGTKNRWSLETEFICPWWTFSHNAYAEQLLNLGVEFRYWLGDRQYHRWLDGWHMGLAVAAGYYDFEWKSRGAQGEHVNAYFNIGYQHRWGIRRQWGIDAGVGLGAIYTPRHRQYLGSTLFPENHTEEYDDHLMYQRHSDLLWPGATHANVSLMYFFDWNRK